MTAVQRRSYDHRLRLAVATSGDPGLFRDLRIPPSTRRSWTTRAVPNVVALHEQDRDLVELQVALTRVEAANAKLRAVIKLLLALLAVRRPAGMVLGQVCDPHAGPSRDAETRYLASAGLGSEPSTTPNDSRL